MRESIDRETVISGISFHERHYRGQLVFRYPNVFDVERHPQRVLIQRLTVYPREAR